MHGYFVTGTDTGVGKTVLSAALAFRLGATYWKPIQTGPDNDTAEVARLAGCSVVQKGIRLPDPVSPHLAAQRAGSIINLQKLVNETWGGPPGLQARLRGGLSSTVIVEGAGGVLVPINAAENMTHLMRLLMFPVIIAVRSSLGTINHTLLTLEALRARSLAIAGVVMIGEPNPDNRRSIENYGDVKVLAEMPRFNPLSPQVLREWASTQFQDLHS